MANKPTYTQLSGDAVYSAADLNTIFDTLATAIEAGLGRQGTKESPNSMSGELDLNLSKIINLAACTADKDAANKKYVDDTVTGASIVPSGVISTTKTAGAAVSWDALLSEYIAQYSDIEANLKNITDTNDGDLIYLQGKNSVGDGGGGVFYWSVSDLSAEVTSDPYSGIYVAPNTDPTGASGAWVHIYNRLAVERFGAVGDGVTDDSGAINAFMLHCNSWDVRKIHAIASPLLIPNWFRITTSASNTSTATGTIKVLSTFTSPYQMSYYDGVVKSYDMAAALMSKAWVDGDSVGDPVTINKIRVDVDSQYDAVTGAVIHGAMLNNYNSDFSFGVLNSTGFGIWVNSQKMDGTSSGTLPNNRFRDNYISNTNVFSSTYVVGGTSRFYNGIHCGPLRGVSSTASGHPSISGKVIDGKIFQTVIDYPCHGIGIFVQDGAGWKISNVHTHHTDLDGIYIKGGDNAIISDNTIEGAASAAPTGYGYVGGITVTGIFSATGPTQTGPMISNNVITLRDKQSTFQKDGTVTFIPISTASYGAGAEVAIIGNKYSVGSDADATHIAHVNAIRPLTAGGKLYISSNDYQVDGYTDIFDSSTTAEIVQEGNSWQYQTFGAKPTTGWHPAGMIINRANASLAEPTGYLCSTSGIPGVWKAMNTAGRSGVTANRPILDSDDAGFTYYDSTLTKLIWWDGAAWKTFNIAAVPA